MAHKYETGYLKVISDKKILLLEKFINERTPANHRIFFYIMRDLGIRPSEALSLKVGDFNFDSNNSIIKSQLCITNRISHHHSYNFLFKIYK